MSSSVDTRSLTLVDIPFVKRLVAEKGTSLDSELNFTRDAEGPHTALFSSIFLPNRGLHTLVARSDKQHVVGQFRLRPDEAHAHIVYIAHELEDADDTACLHILDAMAQEAGRRGAQTLNAEVNENSYLFQTMRIAGFATYARQEIWQRLPGTGTTGPLSGLRAVELTEETTEDAMGIHLLYCNIVPRLVQQTAMLPTDENGLVYRKDERIEGYIAVSEGRYGVYLMPYLHPDIFSEASAIISTAISRVTRASKVPVYVCVRRYQDWLGESLYDLGFEPWTRQAVMVRHIAAGVRQASFAPLPMEMKAVPSSVRTPTSRSSEHCAGLGHEE